jgi:hypothetical protein
MPDSIDPIEPRDRSPGEYIEGFSIRFMDFLDAIDFPKSGRYTHGAAFCSISVNSFRRWCILDVAPRTFTKLEDAIDKLLKHKDDKNISTRKLMAWLYFGDEKDNPFPELDEGSNNQELRCGTDALAFWAWLFSYAHTTHQINLNLLSPRRREILMRNIKSMAADKFGIKLSANNFYELISTEGMKMFREKIDMLIMQSMSR